jgi:hypothetical protein
MTIAGYRNILAVAAIGIFYTNVPGLMHSALSGRIVLKDWVMGFGLLSLPLVVQEMVRGDSLKSPVMLWCFGYAWVTMVWFFPSSQSEMAWQEVRWRSVTIISLLMFLETFRSPEATRWARRTLVIAVVVGVASNIYGIFNPTFFFHGTHVRPSGLYENPNRAGIALVLGMIMSVTVLPSWVRGPFILLTGIGVFVTFSRSGILAWLIAVAGYILLRKIDVKHLFLAGSISLVLVAVAILPQWDSVLTTLGKTDATNDRDVKERMAWLMSPTDISDESGRSHVDIAKRAWDKFGDQPFLGMGTGSYYEIFEIPPHNQYLAFMLDHGILGAAILPLLLLAITWEACGESRSLSIVLSCTLMVVSVFSHDLMSQEEGLVVFALMAAMAAMSQGSAVKTMTDFKKEGLGTAGAWLKSQSTKSLQ